MERATNPWVNMKHPKHFDTDEQTSKRMSHVKLKHSRVEDALAKALWHNGYRYRLNYKKLPGSPDIAITKQKIAVFVDGEFWHGQNWSIRKGKLQRNREYWIEKIEENMVRDVRVDKDLSAMGWTSLRFWSKDVEKNLNECVQAVLNLKENQHR